MDPQFGKGGLALPLIGLFGFVWLLIYGLWKSLPDSAEGSLIGAGVGATVSVAIFWITRAQSKRDTTLELFKEYYSTDFAIQRRSAERFAKRYLNTDWMENEPYDLAHDDADLAGYGSILRYWQRVALLYEEGALDRNLVQRLLARELAHWHIWIFDPMFVRKNIYVREPIENFVHIVRNGPAWRAFKAGERDGRRVMTKATNSHDVGPAKQQTEDH